MHASDIFFYILTGSVVIIAAAILLICIFVIRTLILVHSVTKKIDRALSGAQLLKSLSASRVMDKVSGIMDFFTKKKR